MRSEATEEGGQAEGRDAVNVLRQLHVMARWSLNAIEGCGERARGAKPAFEMIERQVRRIRNLGDRPTVGVFGAPKRGKSTLLNKLLGKDLFPTGPIPVTAAVIEVIPNGGANRWDILVSSEDGNIVPLSEETLDAVSALLCRFATTEGDRGVERIRVTGPFKTCRLISDLGVTLIDTPGAEAAFEGDGDIARHTSRALRMLDEADLTIFCVRADQIGSISDRQFYDSRIRGLDPMNVITMKDKRDAGGDERNRDVSLILDAQAAYGFDGRNTVAVSAETGEGMGALECALRRKLEELRPVAGFLRWMHLYCEAVQRNPALEPRRIDVDALRVALPEGARWAVEAHELLRRYFRV